MTKITPEAIRAGRALLQWSLRDLAAHSGLSLTTVHQAETGKRDPWDASAQAIITTFTAHGVELLGDGAPGARIHRNPQVVPPA